MAENDEINPQVIDIGRDHWRQLVTKAGEGVFSVEARIQDHGY